MAAKPREPVRPGIHFKSLQRAFNKQLSEAVSRSLQTFAEHTACVDFSSHSTPATLKFARGELARGGYGETRMQDLLSEGEEHASEIGVFDLHTHPYELEHEGKTACPSEGDLEAIRDCIEAEGQFKSLSVEVIAAVNPHHRDFHVLFYQPTAMHGEDMPSYLTHLLDPHLRAGKQEAVAETLAQNGFRALVLRKRVKNPRLSIKDLKRIASHFQIHGIKAAYEKQGGGFK